MNKQRGFTLVELLVVIAIIALLMSMLMPALARVKKQAKAAACMSNLSQWGKIFAMYTGDHDGYFMGGWTLDPGEHWTISLRSYAEPRGGIACCPMAAKEPRIIKNSGSTFEPWGLLGDSRNSKDGDYGSYGINVTVYNRPPDRPGGGDRETYEDFWRRADVKDAGTIPVFLDSLWSTGYVWHDNEPPEYDGGRWSPSGGGQTGGNMGIFCMNRHDGFINVLFMDWSVRKVGLKQLWLLNWHRSFDTSGPWTPAGGVTRQDWASHGTGWMEKLKDFYDPY